MPEYPRTANPIWIVLLFLLGLFVIGPQVKSCIEKTDKMRMDQAMPKEGAQ